MPQLRRIPLRRRVPAWVLAAILLAACPPGAAGQVVIPTESETFAAALRTLELRRFASAAVRFSDFRDRYPTSELMADALYHEGAALLALGSDEEAVGLLERFETLYPGHPLSFEARLALGQYYYGTGRAAQALATLRRVVDRKPPRDTASRALYWMGDAAVMLGDDEAALVHYREAADEYRDTGTAPRAQYALAFTLVRMGRYDEAAQAFELLAARHPESDLARNVGLALAEVYYELGDFGRTVSEIRRRLPQLEGDGLERGHFLLAESFNQLRDPANAIIHYRRFTEGSAEGPYFRRAVYGLAWNYYHEGAHQWAAEQFARISGSVDELAAEALYYEGINLALAARPADAAARLASFVERWPDHRLADHALFELGILQYRGRRWEAAAGTFGHLVDGYPRSELVGEGAAYRANTAVALGDFDAALLYFDRAIEAGGADPALRDAVVFQKAWLLYRRERYAEAAEAFAALYSDRPTGPRAGEALFWWAESDFQRDRLDAAVDRFRRYLRDFPGGEYVDAARYALGWAYFRQQRYEAAIPEFQAFLAAYRDPSDAVPYRADAQLRLADSFFALKRYPEAIRAYGRMVADGDDYALFQIGQAYANAGDPLEAIASLGRLLEEFPASEWREEARYSMGYLYFQNQEYDQAIAEYRTLIRDHGSHPLAAKGQYGIGDAHFNAGRLEAAISAYGVVLERYPSSPFAADAAAGIQFALIASGDDARSDAFIDSFAVAHPESPLLDELRFRQAEVRYQSGRVDEATNGFLGFLRSARDERLLPEAYFYLGTIYADRGLAREATTYLGQVIERYPGSGRRAEAASRLGRLQLDAGLIDAAAGTYAILADAAGDDARLRAEALYGRSMALLAQGRFEEAENQLQEAIRAAPDDPATAPAHLGLGRLREQSGQAAAAVASYRTAAARSQDEAGAEALVRLGSLLLRQGDAAGAVEELSRLPARFSGYSDWMARGFLEQARALRVLGRPGEALRMYDALIEAYPNHSAAAEALREREELR